MPKPKKSNKPNTYQINEWTPEIGDKFMENDPRFTRVVEVVALKDDKVQVKTLVPSTNRLTWNRADRFFKRSHGYRYLGGRCHECQLKAGAVVPIRGHYGITVTLGFCGGCLTDNKTLVPGSDYHWPKLKRKAIFD